MESLEYECGTTYNGLQTLAFSGYGQGLPSIREDVRKSRAKHFF